MEAVKVIPKSANYEGNNLTLSKKRVTPSDRERCTEAYSRGKVINSILRRVASVLGYKTNKQLEALHSKTAWAPGILKHKDAYDYFVRAAYDPTLLDKFVGNEETREVLLETLKSRFNQQPVKIRAYIEVKCYTYDGIDSVKNALKNGLALGTETVPIKINLVASPLYVVETSFLNGSVRNTDIRINIVNGAYHILTYSYSQVGIEFLDNACRKIRRTITCAGGTFSYRRRPEVVTAEDGNDLAETTAESKLGLRLDKFDDLGILC